MSPEPSVIPAHYARVALLSPAEAEEVLGISGSTLYKLMKRGELPFLHVAGLTKIATADVAAFIARQRGSATLRKMAWSGDKTRSRWRTKR